MEERKVVTADPENSETPLSDMRSWVTPNRLFFVRNHFETPKIDAETWRLTIDGCVERDLQLTFGRLNELPQMSVFSTVECAGNGRSFLEKPVEGVQWSAGAVGHAEWTGVPLKYVLEEARLKPEAVEIVFSGVDSGSESGEPDPVTFARSLPIEKAMHEDTLLVTRMNGERLEPAHGFPVRLIVPGWYGVASVKWLTHIEAVNSPFQGYFQTVKYTVDRKTGRGTQSEVVGIMPIKSEIIRPKVGEVLGVGIVRVMGLAWAGEDAVKAVEVSVDGGESFSRANLIGPQLPYSWTLWEYPWDVATAGDYTLISRATSTGGHVQPTRHDPLFTGYLINFSRPTTVRVDPARRSQDLIGDAATLRHELSALAEERARMPLDVEMDLTHGGGI